jgi:hypothetical protein
MITPFALSILLLITEKNEHFLALFMHFTQVHLNYKKIFLSPGRCLRRGYSPLFPGTGFLFQIALQQHHSSRNEKPLLRFGTSQY